MNAQNMGTDGHFYQIDISQNYGEIIHDIEKAAIINALERADGNHIATAKILGMHRNTLRAKIRKFNIEVWRFKR